MWWALPREWSRGPRRAPRAGQRPAVAWGDGRRRALCRGGSRAPGARAAGAEAGAGCRGARARGRRGARGAAAAAARAAAGRAARGASGRGAPAGRGAGLGTAIRGAAGAGEGAEAGAAGGARHGGSGGGSASGLAPGRIPRSRRSAVGSPGGPGSQPPSHKAPRVTTGPAPRASRRPPGPAQACPASAQPPPPAGPRARGLGCWVAGQPPFPSRGGSERLRHPGHPRGALLPVSSLPGSPPPFRSCICVEGQPPLQCHVVVTLQT